MRLQRGKYIIATDDVPQIRRPVERTLGGPLPTPSRIGISVLIPTYGRPVSLNDSLRALASSYQFARPESFEVVVIDNKDDRQTEEVVSGTNWPFRATYVLCQKRGKNNALNVGIRNSRYEWLLFLDDDVIVETGYLDALLSGVKRWPSCAAFGGKVLPVWPKSEPCEVADEIRNQVSAFAYSHFEPSNGTGPHPKGASLMENNMMIRRRDLERVGGFDASCGPAGGAYRMGTHGSLFGQFARLERTVVYLNDAVVYHVIRPEQMRYGWLMKRAYSFGRSLAYLRYGARGIDGGARTEVLIWLCMNRIVRQCVLSMKGKTTPMRIAQMERHMLQGMLYERLVHPLRNRLRLRL